ncbi:MAG: TAXI family TRAP transporter solute-binding subunit [Alphaproteobacteria bacterium]|nr:TAXI family TRAP transporter solute-binding subunit [Alphaproteobacteria bacterium]
MKKYICAVATAGLFTLASYNNAVAQGVRFVTIGTGGPTGVYFVAGNSICRMLALVEGAGRSGDQFRQHGIRCAAPSSAGSTYNIGQITEGEFQFGIVQSDWQFHSVNGSKPDRVVSNPDLRAVFSLHPEPYQIVVGADSGINNWSDLLGKRFNIGNPGSGQRGTTEELLEAFGNTIDDFATTTELTSSEQSGALCDGNIDAYGYTVGFPNSGVAAATEGCGARIINLTETAVQDLVNANPFYSFATIPAGTYSTLSADVTTFGVRATFVTSADVPEDIVYEVTRSVFENLDSFRNLHPAFGVLTADGMTKDGLSAPLHPGALRYYREAGLAE